MKKIVVIASMMLFGFINANALGTGAGQTITNVASLTYNVGGVAQTTAINSNEDSFVVDKKIDFIVANNDGSSSVPVAPGSQDQNTTWTLRNDTNADQNFTFTAGNLAGGTVWDTDTKDTETDWRYFYSTTAAPTTWIEITSTSYVELDEDEVINIRVASDIPDDTVVSNGDVMNISLTATAVQSDGSTTEVNTGGAGGIDRKGEIDTVLADGSGTVDGDYDAQYSASGGYIVQAPEITATKTSCVTDTRAFNTTNPKRIPGATIIYTININNAAPAITGNADNVVLSDAIQTADLDDVVVSSIKVYPEACPTDCVTFTTTDEANTGDAYDSGTGTVTIDFGVVEGASDNCGVFEAVITAS